MRILFTITGPWGTGAATVVEGVSNTLAASGHQVKVIFPDSGLDSPEKDHYYGNPERYRIITFPREHNGIYFPTFPLIIPDPNPRNVDHAWTYRELNDEQFKALIDLYRTEFKRVIDEFKPDIIETQHAWLMGYVLSEQSIPYIVGTHNSDQMGFRYDERMHPYAIQCAKRASFIWALSETGKVDIHELYGVAPDKIILMPNGYDQDIFTPRALALHDVLDKYGVETLEDLPVITCVAKMSKTKGIDILLKANEMVQQKTPYTLLIFGSGDLSYACDSPPSERQMKNVHVMGHRPPHEIADFHNISSLSVLPSRKEGFGVAALEAMGCAVPVIAARVGQMENFVVGDIVPPEDHEALASSMIKLLTMPHDEMKRLRKKAQSTALTYSWKDIAAKRLNYYRKAIDRSG